MVSLPAFSAPESETKKALTHVYVNVGGGYATQAFFVVSQMNRLAVSGHEAGLSEDEYKGTNVSVEANAVTVTLYYWSAINAPLEE